VTSKVRVLLSTYAKTGHWTRYIEAFGPDPISAACRAPKHLLVKHGLPPGVEAQQERRLHRLLVAAHSGLILAQPNSLAELHSRAGSLSLGSAATWARLAIQASYSGVPLLGGTPSGRPPNHVGSVSAAVSPIVRPPVAHDMSGKHDPKRINVRTSFIMAALIHRPVSIATAPASLLDLMDALPMVIPQGLTMKGEGAGSGRVGAGSVRRTAVSSRAGLPSWAISILPCYRF
jgi:hypothetical protein